MPETLKLNFPHGAVHGLRLHLCSKEAIVFWNTIAPLSTVKNIFLWFSMPLDYGSTFLLN